MKGFQKNNAKLRTWLLGGLFFINILLAFTLLSIVGGGPNNNEWGKYVEENNLFAPSIFSLFISLSPFLWELIKRIIKLFFPDDVEQKKFLWAIFNRFQSLASKWRLSVLLIAVLTITTGTQMWAVKYACYPNPTPGPYGSEGIALSADERLLYIQNSPIKKGEPFGEVSVFAALPVNPASQGDKTKLIECLHNIQCSGNKIGSSYLEVDSIQVGLSPQGFVRSPDGRYLYVVNGADRKNGTVSIIDLLRNMEVRPPLPVGNTPRWVAISPKGDRVYVSNTYSDQGELSGSISIIDTQHQTVTNNAISGVNCPEGLALSPDGSRLYVASQCGHGQDPLFVIETTKYEKVAEIPGFAVGNAVVLSKDGKKAYVTRANFEWYDSNSEEVGAPLSIVDTETNRIIKTIILQISAAGLALTPDGKYVLVTNGYRLSVIDTATDELINNISLRGYGNAITVRSDGLVIVAVSDARRFVPVPLNKALSRRPCNSI